MNAASSNEPYGAAGQNEASGELDQASGIRSLARGLRILRCFDQENPSWNLSDLSRHLELHRATVHRFLKTLEAEGFLTFDQQTGRYHLGSGAFQLGQVTNSNSELLRVARPHMERLAAACGEAVGLATWTGDGAAFLDIALTSKPFQPRTPVGQVFSDVRTAHCRVLLAFMSAGQRAQALAKARGAGGTKIDIEQFSAELDRTAVEGVAYDLDGSNEGLSAVGVPVRDASGQVRASFTVVAPSERFDRHELETYVRLLKKHASELSHDLGYREKAGQRPT